MHQSHDYFVEVDEPMLSSFDLRGVADKILAGEATNIVTMLGAGVSVSCGIPDFRSPGTGLYDNLQKYKLPYPEAIFDLEYFRANPAAFNVLAKELYPGAVAPSPVHHFVKLLHSKGLLLRCFSQNIDSLETMAGLPHELLLAAHGNFDEAHCIDCHHEADSEHVKESLEADCLPVCESCGGLVKPDIVFFGERLPPRFFQCVDEDLPHCDLLMVMGTSLQVHPFAGLVAKVSSTTPRLLINKEMVGAMDPLTGEGGFFNFGVGNTRDACFLGECDEGIWQLVDLLGWRNELEEMVAEGKRLHHA
eukprot:CAMPEP_0196578742 /NCGR_PEP_ID=MMETSP1081-20130531/7587_1 /TAXON_ID=36882 /ORGANISM="Pyramimonas amylifera, Strain CCMP720" /LENGTH=304 /DNA_ID=CAMNT_0041898053 /DNA_START=222 /DNA_END=1136 /DNA_ORIENTATION=+